ncbi:MAG: purine-nucleoside phosphorylase [Campylobacterales bacterium]|nr:purine-nucleoside phosphorylase [Campylobacterales bacterium]
MIVSAGNQEAFPFAVPIGIGMIESTINLTRLCLFDRPDYLIFIGSAGSYGDHKIFDIVEASASANIELSFLTNESYTPIDNLIKCQRNLSGNNIIVNSSNYISTSTTAKEFMNFGITLENMEFYSVMKVAQEFDIDVLGIFVVTNYANQSAHADFIKNHSIAMEKLIGYLEKKNLIVPHGTTKDKV